MDQGPQEMILAMLRTGRPIRSREFIRLVPGWDHRKAISRLRKRYPIISEIRPGEHEATYRMLVEPKEQIGLFEKRG
jgi:hypothetical protein